MPIGDLYISLLDLLLVLPLFWAVYRGFMTGFIVEALAFAVFFIGLYVYIRIAEMPTVFTEKVKAALEYLPVAMFSIAAIVAFLLSNLTETYSHRSLRDLKKGPIDRSLGAFLSVLRYLLLISCIVIFIIKLDYKYNFLGSNERQKGIFYYRVSQFAPKIFPSLKFNHLENQYIILLKQGAIRNITDKEIVALMDGGGTVSIPLKKALERLASEQRNFKWNVSRNTPEGKLKNNEIAVELNIADKSNEYALNKTAYFRFIIQLDKKTGKYKIKLDKVTVNEEERDVTVGYKILATGEF